MKKERDVDSILDRFERVFSLKIDQLNSEHLFDEMLAEKNKQISALRTLPENAEIIEKLKELERIKAGYIYRLIEKGRLLLLAIPPARWILFLFRRSF